MRVAVIGVAHWHAPRHIESLALAGAAVVGVSEDDSKVAERWGRKLGCPWFGGAAEMLDRVRPDFVFALPRHRDAPAIARLLIARGIPFAIEKPLGVRAADIEPLVTLAEARGVFAAVLFVNRYSAFWDEVRRLRSAGLLAPLVHAHFRIVNGPPQRYVDDGVGWMLDPTIAGGGALRNLGTHAVDAFLALTGESVEVIAAAVSYRQYGLPVEEFATALLRTPSGVIGTIEAGYSRPDATGSDQEWRVAGAGAYLIERNDHLVVATAAGETRFPAPDVASRYVRVVSDTLERFHRGEAPIAGLADCWRVAQVIDRIYALAASHAVPLHIQAPEGI